MKTNICKFQKNTKQAFTLVELSIVLVIIGLLTAGVVGGQSLIRSAQINSIVTDVNSYQTAVNAFKLEYDALPGDMKTATDYWGAVASSCTTAAGTGTQTCNGDGDGMIEGYESIRFWQHLANSGIIKGNYTGTPGSGGCTYSSWCHHLIGVNSPESKLGNKIGYGIGWFGVSSGQSWLFDGTYNNVVSVGMEITNYEPSGSFLNSKDAKKLDDKFDDGKPGLGRVMMRPYTPCLTTGVDPAAPSTATYNLATTTQSCFIYVTKFAE